MTEESLSQPRCPYRVTHALNNNAVAAVDVDSDTPVILVGKGLGFGRRPGDEIPEEDVRERYIAVGEDRSHYLNLLKNIPAVTLEAVSGGVELAEEQLGALHPSVYVILTDHLAFAVQRLAEGQMIENPLLPEIRARFPREFVAAEILLRYVNARLDIMLPIDEAAFITLHLRAAATGETVKRPLSQANALAGLTDTVIARLVRGTTVREDARAELVSHIVALSRRLKGGELRANAALLSIQRDAPDDYALAEEIVQILSEGFQTPAAQVAGEVAFTALFLHGWRQDARRHS
ncbi:PRD domain-containing protein [Schaalia hyovaginalis]|uniref:PRD domain-containing protein n=1 Tax=Schaalia hyovaginalis TaxID=29316 RepID=UPI0026EB3165|nr:PRD domain-containing protein [Schaalia hyovaginalis]MDD7554348.1 PRD domain-containing protein [Schaalia hyovaginalis]MDY3093936.1 PRD domain-containing protein [Schaalia hyovaginalis]